MFFKRQVWNCLCRHDDEEHASILQINSHWTDDEIEEETSSQKHDIRLSDVMIECLLRRTKDILSYKYDKEMQGKEFKIIESLNSLFTLLLTTLNQLDAIHERKEHHIVKIIWTMMIKNSRVQEKHQYSSAKKDRWYESIYIHVNNTVKCDIDCNHTVSLMIQRQSQSLDSKNSIVHYEIIVFADQLMKDVVIRDKISQQHDVMCFEMKMTELLNDFSCIIIQEICNYLNSHKNDEWQNYVTATTTSYVKELLQIILKVQVMTSQRAINVVSSTDKCIWIT